MSWLNILPRTQSENWAWFPLDALLYLWMYSDVLLKWSLCSTHQTPPSTTPPQAHLNSNFKTHVPPNSEPKLHPLSIEQKKLQHHFTCLPFGIYSLALCSVFWSLQRAWCTFFPADTRSKRGYKWVRHRLDKDLSLQLWKSQGNSLVFLRVAHRVRDVGGVIAWLN